MRLIAINSAFWETFSRLEIFCESDRTEQKINSDWERKYFFNFFSQRRMPNTDAPGYLTNTRKGECFRGCLCSKGFRSNSAEFSINLMTFWMPHAWGMQMKYFLSLRNIFSRLHARLPAHRNRTSSETPLFSGLVWLNKFFPSYAQCEKSLSACSLSRLLTLCRLLKTRRREKLFSAAAFHRTHE